MGKRMNPDISKLSELLADTDKEVWGKVFWSILHRVGADSGLTTKWLEEFTEAIVCPFCRAHFKELLRLCPRSCAPDDFPIHGSCTILSTLGSIALSWDLKRQNLSIPNGQTRNH